MSSSFCLVFYYFFFNSCGSGALSSSWELFSSLERMLAAFICIPVSDVVLRESKIEAMLFLKEKSLVKLSLFRKDKML